VHNNYYFLKHLTQALRTKIIGHSIVECFSQSKDELIITLTNGEDYFHIKALLSPSFCCLAFPVDFHRAKKNSIDLFDELLNKKIIGIKQFLNERCFSIVFEDGQELLFKMHGNRSNIVLFNADKKVIKMFNSHLKNDNDLVLQSLDRPIDQSKKAFVGSEGNIHQLFPTFGKVINTYLKQLDYDSMEIDDRWELMNKTLQFLENPKYYLIENNEQINLSLLPLANISKEYNDPIAAINDFFIKYISTESLRKEKKQALNQIQKTLTQSTNYIQKALGKLNRLSDGSSYSQQADIIMANLHQIKTGASEVTLPDFYNNNDPITIKLKLNLSPQKNAENYYRKSKNQSKEISNLKDSIKVKEVVKQTFEKHELEITQIQDFKLLRKYLKDNGLELRAEPQSQTQKPFKELEYLGFVIYIGRNSKSNDKMLQSFTYKEDLWLHAKDVSGSHVIIKHQAGKKFPKDVIEKAAQLAAFHSKRKSDSLCPVIVTPRKFVRKRKGDPAGAVVVDKEDVILVEPKPV
jgi:predicted ribosome quality control (RQC) complex YloA/Tae2 family protein